MKLLARLRSWWAVGKVQGNDFSLETNWKLFGPRLLQLWEVNTLGMVHSLPPLRGLPWYQFIKEEPRSQ